MSKLEDLIIRLCPNGVEYKKLKEVATISRGGSFQKKDYVESGFPCIHYGQIYTLYSLFVDKTVNYISEINAVKQKKAVTNDIIMAVTSENIEDVCKCVAWLGEGEIAVSGHAAIIHHTLDPRYLVYYLHSSMFFEQKVKFAHGTKVIEIKPDSLGDIVLPVPPIEIQHEIARVLDTFTEPTDKLINKLTEELAARKRQYAYYKDALLPFEADDVEWRPLGELSSIVRGASPRPIKSFITDSPDGVSWIKIGDVAQGEKYITRSAEKITKEGAKKSRYVKPGDFILSNSMSFGRPYILKITGCIHDGWLAISDFEEYLSADYLYHILTSDYIQKEMRKRASFGGAVQNLNADIVRAIEIPVLPKDQQAKVVSILDRFSEICANINEILPAEIEARQKQYNYYRDKLLAFKTI